MDLFTVFACVCDAEFSNHPRATNAGFYCHLWLDLEKGEHPNCYYLKDRYLDRTVLNVVHGKFSQCDGLDDLYWTKLKADLNRWLKSCLATKYELP